MSIRELETAIGLELKHGIPLEKQFSEYANYRSSVTSRFQVDGGTIQFPRHLEEYLQEEFNGSHRIENPLIMKAWDEFSDFVHQYMYNETCSDYEAEMRFNWIEENAYFRWVEDDYRHGQHEHHWREAVAHYDALEKESGEPPWMVDRLSKYHRS